MADDASAKYEKSAPSLGAQVQRNLLSIISLVVAFTALGYNTYRNELTETNRNIRSAGFVMLQELSQLQLIADHAHYGGDMNRGNPIDGWGRVLYMRDMSKLVSPEVEKGTDELFAVWERDWSSLQDDEAANERITAAINVLREDVRETITSLE